MTQLKLYLLGTPAIQLDDNQVTVETRKARALLVYLAVTWQRHTRDSLATLFWPEQNQTRARRSLRHALWLLKQAGMDDWLSIDREAVALQEGFWCDMQAFERHINARELTLAVDLYRGDFMTGFTLRDCPAFDEWQFRTADGLKRTLANTLEELVQHQIARGDYDTGIEYAHRWLALDPLHEPAHRWLMRLYAWQGQIGAALRQYDECARLLQDELGVVVDEETQQLYDTIRDRRIEPPDIFEPPENGQPAAPDKKQTVQHNLPPGSTLFLGRERELDTLDTLLASEETRLITIVGPGGMGKSRLALAAAERQLSHSQFPDGVFFVALAPVRAAEHLIPAIIEALGVPPAPDQRSMPPDERLADYLRQKQLLLVLDNCEHLLQGIDRISAMLRGAPGVRILATSRERLRLSDEQLFPLQGLDYPHQRLALSAAPDDSYTQFPACNLFVLRARKIWPEFVLAPDDMPALADICRMVEGMPLGIELAAAWVNILPVGEIAAEIRHGLDLLEANLRDLPLRQRSIRAAFDASWQRMSDDERDIFMRLSIFQGSFTRQAVQEVTAASLRLLTQLTDKSLLQFDHTRDRYEVHQLLQQYAAEKLAEHTALEHAARERHSAYYCQWLHERESDLKGAQQEQALAAIESDIENVHTAWDHAVRQGQIERIRQAMGGLGTFYEWQGDARLSRNTFCRAADHLAPMVTTGEGRRVLAALYAWQGFFICLESDMETAQSVLQQALAVLDDPQLSSADVRAERAFIYAQLGRSAMGLGQPEAWDWYEQSIELFQAIDHKWEISEALAWLGRWAYILADFGRAEQLLEQSLTIKRELGDRRGIAHVLGQLSQVQVEQGRLDAAERLARESKAIYDELGNRYGIAAGLRQLGIILMWCGKAGEAQRALEQSLQHTGYLGNRFLIGYGHSLLGLALSLLGRHADAYTHARTGLSLCQESGDLNQIAWSFWVLGWVCASLEKHDEAAEALHNSVAHYAQIAENTSNPRQMGWALGLLAYVLWRLEDRVQAWTAVRDVLVLSNELHDFLPRIEACAVAAMIFANEGQYVKAAELYTFLWQFPLVNRTHGWLETVGQELAAAVQNLRPQAAATATEQGKVLDFEKISNDLLADIQTMLSTK